MTHSKEITWVPAVYRPLQHPGRPTGHHRWFPTCRHGKPPLALQSSPSHQLYAVGHLHLCFEKGKESTTEQDRDKAHPAVQGVNHSLARGAFVMLSYHIIPSRPPQAPVIAAPRVGHCWSRDGSLIDCCGDQECSACRQKPGSIKMGCGHKHQPSFNDWDLSLEIYLLEEHKLPRHSPGYKLLTRLPDKHRAAGLPHLHGSLLTAGAGEQAMVQDDSSSQLCQSHWYRGWNRAMKCHSLAWLTSSLSCRDSPVQLWHFTCQCAQLIEVHKGMIIYSLMGKHKQAQSTS